MAVQLKDNSKNTSSNCLFISEENVYWNSGCVKFIMAFVLVVAGRHNYVVLYNARSLPYNRITCFIQKL